VVIKIGEETLSITGIDDPSRARRHDPAFDHEKVAAELSEIAAQLPGYRILIAHRPDLIERYTGFDLVVSGHTHGGLLRIPGLLNGLIAPGQGFFPKLTGGVYPRGDTTLVISRGLSRHLVRPRICNRPEIVLIELGPQ
jgi:predicted MPP superfamily phosphohydrolase